MLIPAVLDGCLVLAFVINLNYKLINNYIMANSSDKNHFIPVDLTTVTPTKENKAYLVDKRLLDKLLSKIVPATLDEIKADLSLEIGCAKNKEQLFTNLDEYIYLNKIANLVSSIEAEEAKDTIQPNHYV